MIDQTCAICGKKSSYKVLYPANFNNNHFNKKIFSARRIPDRCHYCLVKCNNCGLIFSNPILEEKEIKKLYVESKLTYYDEIENLNKTYGKYLKKVESTVSKKNNILEIGCGNGFFLKEALKQGFKNVWGVEPSISAINKAPKNIKNNIKQDIFKKGLFKGNFFDLICFFQTLDHIIDPNGFIKNCHEVLINEGEIFCIVHDSNSLLAKLLGEKTPIFDIEHTYLYNKNTLRKIFEKNKFEIVREFNIKNEYSLKYWIRLFPTGKTIKKVLENIIKLLKLENKTIEISAGNIGIVARKLS